MLFLTSLYGSFMISGQYYAAQSGHGGSSNPSQQGNTGTDNTGTGSSGQQQSPGSQGSTGYSGGEFNFNGVNVKRVHIQGKQLFIFASLLNEGQLLKERNCFKNTCRSLFKRDSRDSKANRMLLKISPFVKMAENMCVSIHLNRFSIFSAT